MQAKDDNALTIAVLQNMHSAKGTATINFAESLAHQMEPRVEAGEDILIVYLQTVDRLPKYEGQPSLALVEEARKFLYKHWIHGEALEAAYPVAS